MDTSHALMDAKPLHDDLADALARDGYAIRTAALPEALTLALLADTLALEDRSFQPAGIGRGAAFQRDRRVRSDQIHWLSPERSAPRVYLEWAESLRQALNERLFLGLFDYECHYARYAKGAAYARHLDAFRGAANRVLTTVLYLNPDWQSDDGGQLLIYDGDVAEPTLSVTPTLGTLVLFLSERFPHEVKAARRCRYSIAGWFRRRG